MNLWKKCIALIMALVLMLALLPTTAFAESGKYKNAEDYLYGLLQDAPSLGSEYYLLTLLRAGYPIHQDVLDAYEASVKQDGLNEGFNPSLVMTLTALGEDASNFDNVNYLSKLGSLEELKNHFVTEEAYGLMAVDCGNYWDKVDFTSEDLVSDLLAHQLPDGGWGYESDGKLTFDVDSTAMVIQALAPYKNQEKVKDAIEKGFNQLSQAQEAGGGYVAWGEENAATTAQVMVALCSVGVNPAKDKRFVKNGKTLGDAMMKSYIPNGGFSVAPGGEANAYAAYECLTALVACDRLNSGKTSFFDMSDSAVVLAKGTSISTDTVQKAKTRQLLILAVVWIVGIVFVILSNKRHKKAKSKLS